MLWEYHWLESDFGLTSVQIENSKSLSKVYTASLLNTCNHGQKLGIQKTVLAQNREENSRKERKRREERKYLVCFEGAGEETTYTGSGAAVSDERRNLCDVNNFPGHKIR